MPFLPDGVRKGVEERGIMQTIRGKVSLGSKKDVLTHLHPKPYLARITF